MSPLAAFHRTAEALARRPFAFLPPEEQSLLAKDSADAIATLQAALTAKHLSEGLAFKQLKALRLAVHDTTIDEVPFIQGLRALLAMYRLTTLPPATAQLLDAAAQSAVRAEEFILEYHLALEMLDAKARGMTEQERTAHQYDILRDMGMFYILEYTLQLQFEFEHRSVEECLQLITEGLKITGANLPSLLSCMPTFKKELCYMIMDPILRTQCLQMFFVLEDALSTNDLATIKSAICTFNCALIAILQRHGIETFQGRLLMPYGTNISMNNLLQAIAG